MAERGEPVALKKKETAELLAVLNSYEAALRRIDELEDEVSAAESEAAEITRKYVELMREGVEA